MRLWGPLWTHSLFGIESYNGHMTSLIHSKYRIAEQLSFSIKVSETGFLADKLVQIEEEKTLKFISPLSTLVTLLLPGIYSIEGLQPSDLLVLRLVPFKKLQIKLLRVYNHLKNCIVTTLFFYLIKMMNGNETVQTVVFCLMVSSIME